MELEYSTGIPYEILEMTQDVNGKDEGKSKTVQKSANKTVPKSANNKRTVVWPEFKIPLPDPVLGK